MAESRIPALLDAKVQELEQRIAALEAPPRVVTSADGINIQAGWSDDTGNPLRAYLFNTGVVKFTGSAVPPGNLTQTTVCILPEVYRPGLKITCSETNINNFDPAISHHELYFDILADGSINVPPDASNASTLSIHFNASWFTNYPGGI